MPLLARKDVRDNWENKKADHEQKLSETLGVPWSFTFDPKLIYANCDAEDWANRIGTAVEEYFSDFNSNVKQWVEKYGDDSREELNNICSDHVVEFHPQRQPSLPTAASKSSIVACALSSPRDVSLSTFLQSHRPM